MGKTYLVTGGAGFVGLAVVKLLAKEDVQHVEHVKVLDLFLPEDLKTAVQSESNGPTFEWIICDITDRSQVFEAMKGCDVVLHVASVIPGAFDDDRDTMWRVNVTGTKNIVDACRECGIGELVYVSSLSVVAPNMARKPMLEFDEDTPYDAHPRSYYGETKKAAESYVLAANGYCDDRQRTLFTCAIRPFIIYGQSFGVLRKIYKSTMGSTIISFSNAESKTSLVYVGNIASAIITAGKRLEEKGSQAGGQFYYITDDTPDQPYQEILASSFAVIGFSLSRQPFVPFWLAYIIYWMIFVLSRMMKYFGRTTMAVPSPEYLWRSNIEFTISNKKFAKIFDFTPRFSPEHALEKIRECILRLEKSGFEKPIYDFEY